MLGFPAPQFDDFKSVAILLYFPSSSKPSGSTMAEETGSSAPQAHGTIVPYRYEPELEDGEPVVQVGAGSVEVEVERHSERVGNTDWCSCECCVAMDREVDCLCCSENDAAKAMRGEERCITLHDRFSVVCLEEDVLEVALLAYAERFGEGNKDNRYVCFVVRFAVSLAVFPVAARRFCLGTGVRIFWWPTRTCMMWVVWLQKI